LDGAKVLGTSVARDAIEAAGGTRASYTYDAASQLTQRYNLKRGDSVIASFDYQYNAVGSRLVKEASGASPINDSIRLGRPPRQQGDLTCPLRSDSYLMETDENGTTTAVYTNEPDPHGKLISQRRDGATSYHHFDGQQSTRELTNASETVTDTYTYKAFGETVASSGTTTNPFRYVGWRGYYHDSETSDYYVRARTYAPATGRWISEDPIGFRAGINLYRYVDNSPLRRTDPTGLAGCCGKEIGGMLDDFSLRAHQAFYRMMVRDPSNALLACIGKDNYAGWDILDLIYGSKYQFSTDGCGTNECRGTVMVHDQCHWASEVHYFLWGLANHLCASAIWRDGEGEPWYVGSHWFTERHAVDLATLWGNRSHPG